MMNGHVIKPNSLEIRDQKFDLCRDLWITSDMELDHAVETLLPPNENYTTFSAKVGRGTAGQKLYHAPETVIAVWPFVKKGPRNADCREYPAT